MLRFGAPSTGEPIPPFVAADPDFDLDGDGASMLPGDGRPLERQSRDLGRGELRFDRLLGTRMEGQQVAVMLSVEP